MKDFLAIYRRWLVFGIVLLELYMIGMLIRQDPPLTETEWLTAYSTENDFFRAMDFGEDGLFNAELLAAEWNADLYEILAVQLIQRHADSETYLSEHDEFQKLKMEFYQEKPIEWTKLVNGFRTVLSDIQYFPVAVTEKSGLSVFDYENGWGEPRTYGGDRLHEGTDIMDLSNTRGIHPIVSITDGVIEHIGWLEQGGYRIGIRSPHGAYFYYAHMDSYVESFEIGQSITAGQIIGFMGDSGYSAVEGTVGNFPVHLHLGIYLETDHYDELSVNPYYILKYLENYTVFYAKEEHLCYTVNCGGIELCQSGKATKLEMRTGYGNTIVA